MLAKIGQLNQDDAKEISAFASFYHNLAAQEITQVITESIIEVSLSFQTGRV